jgi:hypothetical protein
MDPKKEVNTKAKAVVTVKLRDHHSNYICWPAKRVYKTESDVGGAAAMQLHTGTDHFGNVIKRGTIKRGCS